MKFQFVGNLEFSNSKVPAVRELGKSGIGINASIVASKSNRAFVEATGWQNDKILTRDADYNSIEVAWDDRFDEEVIDKVANNRRYVVSIDGNRHEFIASYDFCEYIKDHMDELKNQRVIVKGETQEHVYKGKITKRLQMTQIISAANNNANGLEIATPIYFNKDSFDTTDFKEEHKIYINAYTREFISKKDLGTDKGANRYVPIQLVLDFAIDESDEKKVNGLKINMKNLGLEKKDGKITCKLKSNQYYANYAKIRFYNGAKDMGDAGAITYDMLTDMQKMKVDLGLASIEDFATKGHSYGERITEYRIYDFANTDDYANGYIETDETASEFEELIFTGAESDNNDDGDIMPKPQTVEEEDDDDFEDIFS